MAKRLQEHLNSTYVELASRLRPKNAARKVVAYVESYDDVFFWRTVLQDFETERIRFEVMLPSRRTLSKGKKAALMNRLGPSLGDYMIACVDADYDYILRDATEGSRFINHSPYVVHTYVYAIENFQCWAPSLHRAVVTATLNDRPVLDYEAFLREYSLIIWPLFVWNIWCYRHDRYKSFTMMDFCGFVSFRTISPARPEEALAQLRRRVNQKMAWMQRHFPEAKKSYASLKQELRDLGITPETTYLYIQGHTLFENVVMPLLEPICTQLRKEREREIKALAVHAKQRQCELSSYQHSVMSIDLVLKKNTAFKEAAPFQLVRTTLQRIIAMEAPTAQPPLPAASPISFFHSSHKPSAL